MKTTLKIYFFFVISVFLYSCSSPLEDIEINDFNLIRAKFNIKKNINSNGTITDNIELVIEDKNFMNFELKGAEITVNGEKMQYDNSFLAKHYTSNLAVEFNKKYEFVITLANGEIVKTSLIVPYVNYNSISYPKTFTIGKDYKITWEKQNVPVSIAFVLSDNSKEQKNNYYFNKELSNDKGIFTILGDETKYYKNAKNCYFILNYNLEYEVPNKLRGGSSFVNIKYNSKDINLLCCIPNILNTFLLKVNNLYF